MHKPRVPVMVNQTGVGAHRDQKKQANKNACRSNVAQETDGYPVVTKIEILSTSVDEWYGVEVLLEWTGYDPTVDEKAIAMHVAQQIVDSPEYDKFYQSNRTEICQEYEGGPATSVRIPRFRPDEFNDWGFNPRGGWISAAIR